jgi:hypothetical protein
VTTIDGLASFASEIDASFLVDFPSEIDMSALVVAARAISRRNDAEAVVEVYAALGALIWCVLLVGLWMQWAARTGQPVQDIGITF